MLSFGFNICCIFHYEDYKRVKATLIESQKKATIDCRITTQTQSLKSALTSGKAKTKLQVKKLLQATKKG